MIREGRKRSLIFDSAQCSTSIKSRIKLFAALSALGIRHLFVYIYIYIYILHLYIFNTYIYIYI